MDIPKMMDIASLYWFTSDEGTRKTISIMLQSFVDADLTRFPNQMLDLSSGLTMLLQNMLESLGLNGVDAQNDTSTVRSPDSKIARYNKTKLRELVYNILELGVNTSSFLESCPRAASFIRDNTLVSTIIAFYEVVFPRLEREIILKFSNNEANFPSLDQSEDDKKVTLNVVKDEVVMAKSLLVKTVRIIVQESCLLPILDESLDTNSKGPLYDLLLDTMTFIISLKNFYRDYSRNYPVNDDIQTLLRSPAASFKDLVDSTRIEYLTREVQGYSTFKLTHDDQSPNDTNPPAPAFETSVWEYPEDKKTNKKNKKKKNAVKTQEDMTPTVTTTAVGGGMEEVKLVSLISGIKDILPDLGEGFIELCLESFGFDNEATLNALLIDDLPEEIKSLNRQFTREDIKSFRLFETKRKSISTEMAVPEVIASRANIFDGDEFDIHRNKTIDLSRIHVGKRELSVTPGNVDNDIKKRTLLLQEKMIEEEEAEEIRLMAELGITDPNDFYVG